MMVPMEDMSTTQERTSRPKKGAMITKDEDEVQGVGRSLVRGMDFGKPGGQDAGAPHGKEQARAGDVEAVDAGQDCREDSKAKDDAARGSECQIDHMSGMPEDGKVAD